LQEKFIIFFIKFHKNAPLLPNVNLQINGTIILPAVYVGMELGLHIKKRTWTDGV
jgi:hypothetical protein